MRPTASSKFESGNQPVQIDLTIPSGEPIKIALDQEVRIKATGQPVHGRVIEPVYVFDKLVIPTGTEALGTIEQIGKASKKQRTLSALDANFSPARSVKITFHELVLANGTHLPIQTIVIPAASGVLEFVSAGGHTRSQNGAAHRNVVSRNVGEARREAKREWDAAMHQLHTPGKMHRLERLAEAESPVHHQYIEAGTAFDASLTQPVSFGTEAVTPETLAGIASMPPSGGVVHARLTAPLTSATASKGDLVEAVVTQPVMDASRLVLPVGTRLQGSVLEVHRARSLKRNGELRILFRQLELPNGLEEKIESSLEGVEVARGENLKLDAEGGAQATTPRSRYFTTAVQVALATSVVGDRDAGRASADGGGTGTAAANGASGYRLVGALMSAVAHSRVVSSGFGFYGAGASVYTHFLAKGRDVEYPRNMSMLVSLSAR